MQQKQASPGKTPKRSPRKTPSKKRTRPQSSSSGQSPNQKKEQSGKLKQLRMDVFSPKKPTTQENSTTGNAERRNSESDSSQSPFKVPKSPASRWVSNCLFFLHDLCLDPCTRNSTPQLLPLTPEAPLAPKPNLTTNQSPRIRILSIKNAENSTKK